MAGAIQLHPCAAAGIQRSLYRPCTPHYCASVAAGRSETPCQLPPEIGPVMGGYYGGVLFEHTDRRQFYLSPDGKVYRHQPSVSGTWLNYSAIRLYAMAPPYVSWSGWDQRTVKGLLDG